jgi:3-phenylpropionate/trans-cinnamate dioxygenase ferredoxin component
MRIDLLAADEVAPGEMKMAWVDGTEPVLVVNVDGDYRAFQGICSHEYFELDRGFLTGGSLTCALHLSRFDLGTGDALDPPAEQPIARYVVVVEDGRVQLEAEGPLEVNE